MSVSPTLSCKPLGQICPKVLLNFEYKYPAPKIACIRYTILNSIPTKKSPTIRRRGFFATDIKAFVLRHEV